MGFAEESEDAQAMGLIKTNIHNAPLSSQLKNLQGRRCGWNLSCFPGVVKANVVMIDDSICWGTTSRIVRLLEKQNLRVHVAIGSPALACMFYRDWYPDAAGATLLPITVEERDHWCGCWSCCYISGELTLSGLKQMHEAVVSVIHTLTATLPNSLRLWRRIS